MSELRGDSDAPVLRVQPSGSWRHYLEAEMEEETLVGFWRILLPRKEFEDWLLDYRATAAWENEGGALCS